MKRNNKKTEIDLSSDIFHYPEFEKDAIKRLSAGDRLLGKEGVLTGLVQGLVNAAFIIRRDRHLKSDRSNGVSNRRNGYTSKTLNTEKGAARKDKDEVSADLKKIYTTAGEPEARIALVGFDVSGK